MKTLSFRNFVIGRSPNNPLLELDSSSGFSISSGLHLLIAPNGFGKTTLLQTLAGLIAPLKGGVELDHQTIQLDQSSIYMSEYLAFPKYIYPHEWVRFQSRDFDDKSFNLWLDRLDLTKKKESYLGRMSQGERRKVTWISVHLSGRPIVLLDEPLDGLDLLAVPVVKEMLTSWKAEGRVCILVSHQPYEVFDLADSIFFVEDRKLIDIKHRAASPKDLEKLVREFYGGPAKKG